MKKFLISLLSIVLFLSCKKDFNSGSINDPGAVSDNSQNIINKNVHVIDTTKLVLNTDPLLINQGRYEYTYSGKAPDIFDNDIIVGSTGEGYIRRVSTVTNQANKIILQIKHNIITV